MGRRGPPTRSEIVSEDTIGSPPRKRKRNSTPSSHALPSPLLSSPPPPLLSRSAVSLFLIPVSVTEQTQGRANKELRTRAGVAVATRGGKSKDVQARETFVRRRGDQGEKVFLQEKRTGSVERRRFSFGLSGSAGGGEGEGGEDEEKEQAATVHWITCHVERSCRMSHGS